MRSVVRMTALNAAIRTTAFDSQWISIDPATTFAGGSATITVCQGEEGPDEDCDTRTYRTLG